MKTSQNGRRLIEEFEGLFLKTYDDANDRIVQPGDSVRGVLTIGYGHTTSAGPPTVHAGMTITKELADQYLANDLGKVETDVTRLVKVPLNQNQFDALVSFHYNTGALGKASLLKKLNAGDYQGAADGLLAWDKAKQIGPGPIPGLVRRRKAERELFLKKSISNTGAGAAGAVVVAGGGAIAAAQSGMHWGWIVLGLVVVGVVVYLVIHHMKGQTPNDLG